METSEARRETSRERSVNSSNREHRSKKTSNRPSVIQSRPKKWETSGDRCKNKHPAKCIQSRQRKHLTRPRGPRGRQAQKHAARAPRVYWRQGETSGRQVQKHAARAPRVYWRQEETRGRQARVRETRETSGRQVYNHAARAAECTGDRKTRETSDKRETSVKSCGSD